MDINFDNMNSFTDNLLRIDWYVGTKVEFKHADNHKFRIYTTTCIVDNTRHNAFAGKLSICGVDFEVFGYDSNGEWCTVFFSTDMTYEHRIKIRHTRWMRRPVSPIDEVKLIAGKLAKIVLIRGI